MKISPISGISLALTVCQMLFSAFNFPLKIVSYILYIKGCENWWILSLNILMQTQRERGRCSICSRESAYHPWLDGRYSWLILDTHLKTRINVGCWVVSLCYLSIYQLLALVSSGHPRLSLMWVKSDLKETRRSIKMRERSPTVSVIYRNTNFPQT